MWIRLFIIVALEVMVTAFYILFKMTIIIAALALVFLTGTHARIFSETCSNVTVVQNFNVTSYSGKWYEQQKYPFLFEFGGKCISADYSLNADGTVKVLNQQFNTFTGNSSSIKGSARLASTTGEAKLLVSFPAGPVEIEAPYWVLSTDYEKFSVVWACSNSFTTKKTSAWILTRERNPSQEIIDEALKVFEEQHIPTTPLTKTDQKDCPE